MSGIAASASNWTDCMLNAVRVGFLGLPIEMPVRWLRVELREGRSMNDVARVLLWIWRSSEVKWPMGRGARVEGGASGMDMFRVRGIIDGRRLLANRDFYRSEAGSLWVRVGVGVLK